MKARITIAAVLLTAWARAQPPTLPQLAQEWAELRSVRGHFQGGNWNPTVDSWGQRKHQVLAQLGARLGRRGTPESHVLAWLGAPDEKAMPGTRWWKLTEHGPGTHLLIYCWRSHHDFLFFVCDGPRVVSSNWWMAEE